MADEFEFKPLTEGLGFHKKVVDIQEDASSEPEGPKVIAPPPRRTPSEMPTPRYTDKVLPQNIPGSRNHGPVRPLVAPKVQPQAQPTPQAQTLKKVGYNWGSAIFDTLMVLGFSSIFAAAVFAVTDVGYTSVTELLQSETPARVALGFLIFSVYELYVIISRVFFGSTFGEWVFGIRVGKSEQQQRWWYPLAVAWRGVLVVITGVITLPVISTILKTDIAGLLSGIHLYRDNR